MNEEDKERIKRIVERCTQTLKCPFCGFMPFKPHSVHPYAGVNGYKKSQTIWCNGETKIYPKGYIHREVIDEMDE